MSEPFVRSRPVAGGYDVQGQRPGSGMGREDPLAELARLVGKEDPFRGSAPRAPVSNVARFPQLGAPQHEEPAPAATSFEPQHEQTFGDNHETAYPDFDAQLRGSLDVRRNDDLRPRDALRFPAAADAHEDFEPAVDYGVPALPGEAPALNADLWAEGALPQGADERNIFDEPLPAEDGSRSPRRTLMVLAAVLLLTGGGLGATFLMRENGGVTSGSGAAPTILASDTPVKVQAPDAADGGATDGNTALLEKTGSDKVDHAKVVAANEQPVDLNQLPKPKASQPETAPAQPAVSPNPFPEPRKVKTVLIRPDGSVVGDAQAASAPTATAPIGMVMPTGADGGSPPSSDAAVAAPPPGPVAKPATPKSTARVSATPKDGTATGGASGAKQPASPPRAVKPKPVAVADRTAAQEAPAAAPGSWSVQLAAPPTEQDAKVTAARLQKKYSDELGGLKPSIRKADDKSVYRVRVGSLSQDDAKTLCSKLQAGGGSCFVVRN